MSTPDVAGAAGSGAGAGVCAVCGAALEPGSAFCGACGARVPVGAGAAGAAGRPGVPADGGVVAGSWPDPNAAVSPGAPGGAAAVAGRGTVPGPASTPQPRATAAPGWSLGADVDDAVAPVWRRLVALLVDQALAVLVGGAGLLAVLPALRPDGSLGALLVPGLLLLLLAAGQWFAEAFGGRTVGGALLGTRTVSARTGRAPGLWAVLVRSVVQALGILLGGVGVYVVAGSGAWDEGPEQRGWHDKAAGTLVLRARAPRREADPPPVPAAPAPAPASRPAGPTSGPPRPAATEPDASAAPPAPRTAPTSGPPAPAGDGPAVHAAPPAFDAPATAPGAPARPEPPVAPLFAPAAASGDPLPGPPAASGAPLPEPAAPLPEPAAPAVVPMPEPAAASGDPLPVPAARPVVPLPEPAGPPVAPLPAPTFPTAAPLPTPAAASGDPLRAPAAPSGAVAAPAPSSGEPPAAPVDLPGAPAPGAARHAAPAAADRGEAADPAPADPAPSEPAAAAPGSAGPQPADAPPGLPDATVPTADLGDVEHTRVGRWAGSLDAASSTLALVLDTGERVAVAGPGLVGRRPAPGAEQWAHLVTIDDPEQSVSSTHLAFWPVDGGLDVVDRGSTNGTVLLDASGKPWSLPSGQPARVGAGWTLVLGSRRITVTSA